MSGTTFRKLRLFSDVNLVLELRADFKPSSPDGHVITKSARGVSETRYFTFEWNSQAEERNLYSVSQLEIFLEEYLDATTRIPFLQGTDVRVVVYPKAVNQPSTGLKTLSSIFPRFLSQIFMGKTTIVLD